MKCPVCTTNDAQIDSVFGILPCKECQIRQSHLRKPGAVPEMAGDSIREGRKAHANDIENSHRKGELNKRWLELYGKDAAKRHGFTDREIKNAKYVYQGDTTYYSIGDK